MSCSSMDYSRFRRCVNIADLRKLLRMESGIISNIKKQALEVIRFIKFIKFVKHWEDTNYKKQTSKKFQVPRNKHQALEILNQGQVLNDKMLGLESCLY